MKKFVAILSLAWMLSLLPSAVAQTPAVVPPSAELVGFLPSSASGTSALFWLDGRLWTANDHGTLRLFAIDTLSAHVDSVVDLGVSVYDLEAIAQNDRYLFFGDFGDNAGSRHDLRILRLAKHDLRARRFRFDTLRFAYPDRSAATARDFDCEAFIATADSLYLFTKQWLSQGSVCYSLPATPGSHTARRRFFLPTAGLVTDACFLPDGHRLLLLGYTLLVKPFVYIVDGCSAPDFHLGSHRRIALANSPSNQTEGLFSHDGTHLFLTREKLSLSIFSTPAALLKLSLRPLLPPAPTR